MATVQVSVYTVMVLFSKGNRFLETTTLQEFLQMIRWSETNGAETPGNRVASMIFLEVISQVWVIMTRSDFNNHFRQALQNPYDELRANCEFHALTYIKYCISLRLSTYKFQEQCCLETLDELWGHTLLRSRGQKVCDDILDKLTHSIIYYG